MNFEHYKKFCQSGVNLENDTPRERLMLAGMGLGGEAGEVCDHAKKAAFHGVEMDRAALVKEMGDVLWYFAVLASLFDITLDEITEQNVIKLCDRYPGWYGDPVDWLGKRPARKKPEKDLRSELGLTADGHPVGGYAGRTSAIG